MFRLNNTQASLGFRVNGIGTAEIIPAPNTMRPAGYTVPVAAGMSAAAVAQMIAEETTKDNVRDDAAYEGKIPNLLNIYRSAKL